MSGEQVPRPALSGAAITRSAARVGTATMISRLFGLARDTAFAALFGTGFVADAFNLAFLVPNFFRRVVGEGNLNPAFVPVFTELRERRGAAEAGRFLRRASGALLAVLAGITLLGVALAGPLVHLYAHDWRANPDHFAFAVRLLRILFPYLLFAGGAALASAALNARGQFLVPALAPVLLNVFFLTGAAAALAFPRLEARAVAFALGGLAGGLATWLVQLRKMHRMGMPLAPAWEPGDANVRRVSILMIPGVLALAVTQLNLFVDTLLALRLEEGSLTALRLGNRVTLLPMGVIAVAVSTTSLPALSVRAAHRDRPALVETLAHTIRVLVTLLVPAAVGLLLLAPPIVALLFQRGEFSAERSAPMTAGALFFYALGVPAYGVVRGMAQGFYSVQDTRSPVVIGSVSVAANIGLNLLLMGPLGLRGLALATALAAWLNAGLLFHRLGRRVGPLPRAALGRSALRTVLASLALAAGCLLGTKFAGILVPGESLAGRAAGVGVPIFFGLASLLGAFRLLRHEEMEEILASLLGRGEARR